MNSSSSTFKKQIGFTLIEISIVMIIVGLMVVGFIQSYKIYDEKRKIELTELRMNDIEQAINNYALINGRLPCPAARNVPGANYDSGKAVDCSTAIPPGVIDVPGQDVLIGLLPTYDLGISHGSSRDSHNYAFTYAVTKSLANGTATGAGGAITVNEEYFEDVNADPDVQNIQRRTETYPDVQYVVLSAGETGAGAYAYDGAPLYGHIEGYACQDDDTTDGENCDDDHIFTDSRAANEFYDDRVRYKRLLPVLTASNDGGCEQQEIFSTTGASCPNGWDVVDVSASNATPAFGSGNGSKGSYYNIDPETGEYYFSRGVTDNTVHQPQRGGNSIFCEKAASNTNQGRCFSKQVNASIRAARIYDNNGVAPPLADIDTLQRSCPNGYKLIDGYRTSAQDGMAKGGIYVAYYDNVVCGK